MKHHRNDTQTPGTPINIVVGRAVMDGTMIQSGPGTVMVFCNGYQVELDDDYMAEKSVGKVDGIEAVDLVEISIDQPIDWELIVMTMTWVTLRSGCPSPQGRDPYRST